MAANFEFTDKTQTTIESAVQLAKDYANAQGMLSLPFEYTPPSDIFFRPVHPAHIAFVLLNETGPDGAATSSLFSSVIQRSGGDVVSTDFIPVKRNLS